MAATARHVVGLAEPDPPIVGHDLHPEIVRQRLARGSLRRLPFGLRHGIEPEGLDPNDLHGAAP